MSLKLETTVGVGWWSNSEGASVRTNLESGEIELSETSLLEVSVRLWGRGGGGGTGEV